MLSHYVMHVSMKCASCTALKKCVQDSFVRHKLNKTKNIKPVRKTL